MFEILLASPVTLTLLLANVAFSLYALYSRPALLEEYAFVPERIWRHGEWHRMLTAGFLHVHLPHLLFNMITLFFFGPILEWRLGVMNYLVVYFGAELAAHLVPLYKYRTSSTYAAVGASGSISGVVVAFSLFYPLEPLYLFFIPIGIPAVLLAVGFMAYSFYASNRPQSKGSIFGRVAHEAHLGGAVGGLLLTLFLDPGVLPDFFRQLLGVFF